MKFNSIILMGVVLFSFMNCSDTSTNSTANTSTIETSTTSEENNTIPDASPSTVSQSTPEKPKTDEEIIFEAAELTLNAISDIAEKQKTKDSIRQAEKDRMFAFQIGMKMREDDAYALYHKLTILGIPSIYVFRAGRKEYYVVQFEAKGEEELSLLKGDFKNALGDSGSEGLKIINLNEAFCPKRKSVTRETIESDGDEIKCLFCD